MLKRNKAIVLFSGGQDSTTCLFWAKERFGEVQALNISYGQRHHIESVAAWRIATINAKVPLQTIEFNILEKIGNSSLLDRTGIKDINLRHPNSDKLPASFVPGRNIFFLTTAAAIAYKEGIHNIVTGVCQTDYSGYPDCRAKAIILLEFALSEGMDFPFKIHTPLMDMTKKETVQTAKKLPGCWEALAHSHTCYEGAVPPCGICPACKLRQKGFDEAGEKDPLIMRLKNE